MTVFDKARELAEMIMESEEAARRDCAIMAFSGNETSQKNMDEYQVYQMSIQEKMEKGELTREEFQEATEELKRRGTELKKDPITAEFIDSTNGFNQLVNQVFDIIRSTILGDEAEEGCGCGCGEGDCGDCDDMEENGSCGCGHCH